MTREKVSHDDRQAILAAVDERRDEIVQLLQEFVRIPTINPPGEEYESFVDSMGSTLETLGYEVEVIRVPEARLQELAPHGDGLPRPNLVARLRGVEGGLRVHLNGHYDVVPVGDGWSHEPFGGDLENGRVYGRGATDMKGGLVAQIFAVEALRQAGVPWTGSITQSAVPDEETVGVTNAGTYFLVEQEIIHPDNTDAVIITEPFGSDGVGIGHKGAIWGEITIYGKQAHGSSPLLGVNAVERAAEFLAVVDSELRPRLLEKTSEFAVTPRESTHSTLSFDTIHGGVATNVVPDKCTLTFNRRLLPSEDLDAERQELLSLLEKVSDGQARFQYQYKETYATLPTIVSDGEPLVQTAQQVVASLGLSPRLLISAGSDDQRFIVHNAGITNSIIYGPGCTGDSHTSDESIEVEELITTVKGLALILADLLVPDSVSGFPADQ
ncbi:MAG: ArgE/DapE family deacylase [Rubrobacteraceae bacterium]